jgi:hypothetical protein
MNLRRWTLPGLFLAFLAGCTTNVNLIQYHRGMDRWDDTPAQVEAKYKETRGLYKEIMRATSAPSLAPYPTMNSNLKSMKRYLDKVQKELGNIQKAKKNFAAYAHKRRTVTSKDKAGWAEFQNQAAEYTAYASAMSSHVGGFNRAFYAFYQAINAHGIEKTSNQEIRVQVEGMVQDFNSESKRMENSLADKISGMAFGTLVRRGPGVNRRRRATLTEMGEALERLPLLKTTMYSLAKNAREELAGDKKFWTGPGMSERPNVVDDVARAHGQFAKIKTRFAELEAEFDEIGKRPPHGGASQKTNRQSIPRKGPS